MNNNKNLANFIIAGVNKAGSTSLFHYLNSHPDICGSLEKETCYFLPLLYGEQPGSISNYREQFLHCNRDSKYRMESTPGYFYGSERIAGAIKKTLGDVKILIILKDPIERIKSFYSRKKSTFQLPEDLSFDNYVGKCLAMDEVDLQIEENQMFTGVYFGEYSRWLPVWFETFKSDLKVVFFDQLQKNPAGLLRSICEWLNIDSSFYTDYDFYIRNKSVNFRYKQMHKMAISLNHMGNKIWRNNPKLKMSLLRSYYMINGRSLEESDFSEHSIGMLQEHYLSYNRELYNILQSEEVENIPGWLSAETVDI